ncbi:MAG: hypothetical protein U0793_07540 [Gemmataceae bacterium]
MNENQSASESLDPIHPAPRRCRRFLGAHRTLVFGALLLGLPAIVLAWIWLKEPSRPPALLAGDRQRMEAFLAAHDYEAFLRVMELQPRAARAELPPEWLRRYDEIKPALLFTVREVSTEEVIDAAGPYQAPLLSLRWSENGEYLVDVLASSSKRKVFDGRAGRPVSVGEQPTLLAETDAHWPLGQLDKPETMPTKLSDQLVERLCFSFGHDPTFWQARHNRRPVLLMPSPDPDHTRMLTSFAVNPKDVAAIRAPPKNGLGEYMPHFPELFEEKVNVHQRRCFNVWKADAFRR